MADSPRANLTPTALALVAIVAVSIIAGVFAYRAVEANRTALFAASRARLALETYLTLAVDQETAVRAYDAANGSSAADFLAPYREANARFPAVLHALLSLGNDRGLAAMAAHVRNADRLHQQWMRTVARSIVANPASTFDVRYEVEGKALMDSVRREISAAERIADTVVTDRRSAASTAVAVSFAAIVFFVIAAGIVALRSEWRFAAGERSLRAQIEERNRALERSNAALAEFAYVASHDLQEPLRSVAGFTQLLRKRYAGKLDEDANEFIEFAVDGAVRMQQLIDDILTYSRVTTHGKPFEAVSLGQSAQRAVENLRFAIEAKNAQVLVEPLPPVSGDPVQLTQLFQNLIGNALKYGGVQPRVRVGAERDGEVWRVFVADNGIGIAPEYQDRVFRIFQRLHTRSEYSGTGIGLAICKGIVERHGGRIWVESEAGAGATFWFTLHEAKESRQTA